MSGQGKWSVSSFDDRMSFEQVQIWIRKQLNREPESADLYDIGKTLYQAGQFNGAAKVLKAYAERQGAELPGFHLLGYAYAQIGECEQSCRALTKVVNSGFDSDWQLLVQMRIEADEQQRERERQNIRDQYFEPIRQEHQKQQQEAMERLMGSSVYSIIKNEYMSNYESDDEITSNAANSPSRSVSSDKHFQDHSYESPISSNRSNSGTGTPTKVVLKDDFSLAAELSQITLDPLPEMSRLNIRQDAHRQHPVQSRRMPPVQAEMQPKQNIREKSTTRDQNMLVSPVTPATPLLAPLIDQQDVLPISNYKLRTKAPPTGVLQYQPHKPSQSPQTTSRPITVGLEQIVPGQAPANLPSIHGKVRVPVATATTSTVAIQGNSVRRTLIKNPENASSKNRVNQSLSKNQSDAEFD